MTPRNTTTGAVLEHMIPPSLTHGGYSYEAQKIIGQKMSGRKHVIDYLVKRPAGDEILLSVKWQQTGGTAEEKVPYEVLCLIDKVKNHGYKHAYLVLAGTGWTLRDFYVNHLNDYLEHKKYVTILSLEDFCARANQGKL